MPFRTAAQNKIPGLYHWQRFDATWFEQQIRNGTVYCSTSSDFNDPWDCKPFFNTDLLADASERQKHIDWAVEICKRAGRMSDRDMERMKRELQNPAVLERHIHAHTAALRQTIVEQYRVYCLCPNVYDLLMWAHYADRHRGICLEFNVQNYTICGAQQVEYCKQFPITRQYSNDPDENVRPLLTKGEHQKHENEYRIIAQEESLATAHGTLLCRNGQLQLASGALLSVIVGHNGPYEQVRDLVGKYASNVKVLRAQQVPNRYELKMEP